MTTTNGNRKILDLKRWEFCAPAPVSVQAGALIASSRHFRQQQLYLRSNTEAYIYNPSEDAWVQLASPGLAGTFGAGAAGVASAWSTGSTIGAGSLTATGGTTSTIVTNQTLARDLRGYKVHILSGPNNGSVIDIVSNTVGANATITVAAQASAFTASTVYRLLTPRWYVLGAGTLAAASFRVYDYATNTWTTLSQTGLAATIGTDGKLIATPSIVDGTFKAFATGTATAGGASTIDNSAKAWTTNQWTNFQIRLTAGTGAGQIRTISSNTGTQITVSAAWTTQPDATSQYSIEGNDNFLYYIGNNAVTLYRYDITANTWSTLTPGVARGGNPVAGMSGHWVHSVEESDWNVENSNLNGRRIYSFRGNGSALDYYDIASNAWTNGITFSPSQEAFGAGTKYTLHNGKLFIQLNATGRWFYLDIARSELFPWSVMLYPQSTAVVGDTAFDVIYEDGATDIYYVYMLLNSLNILLRQMVI